MKLKLILLALAALALAFQMPLNAQADKSTEIGLRGVVEGFYGIPWTHEQRLDMLTFMAGQGFNAYIYAPKDDEYHRKYWRVPYPEAKYRELQELSDRAKELHIDVIFAVSPGNDIDFSGSGRDADRKAMVEKLDAMYNIGIRHFALFFDDIPTKDASGQVAFANWINSNFIKKKQDCHSLILVPTEYYLKDMEKNNKATAYTSTVASKLDKDILILYTGAEVCPDGLDKQTVMGANKLYGRSLGIWWNYPVSDYLKEKLALGPLDKMPTDITGRDIPALFINPMEKAELSKIAIATGAAYAKNPAGYDENTAWERAIEDQYGDLSSEMKLFAGHSQRMENNWAHIGRQDAQELANLYKALWPLVDGKGTIPKERILEKLLDNNQSRKNAITRLLNELPRNVLAECDLQLMQLSRMTDAERYALLILQGKDSRETAALYDSFKKTKAQIDENSSSAKISEQVLGKFINDFVSWNTKNVGALNSNG